MSKGFLAAAAFLLVWLVIIGSLPLVSSYLLAVCVAGWQVGTWCGIIHKKIDGHDKAN